MNNEFMKLPIFFNYMHSYVHAYISYAITVYTIIMILYMKFLNLDILMAPCTLDSYR